MRQSYGIAGPRRSIQYLQADWNSPVRYTLSCYHATKPARYELLFCVATKVGRGNVRIRNRESVLRTKRVLDAIRPSLYVYILERRSICCKCGKIDKVAGASVRLMQRVKKDGVDGQLECRVGAIYIRRLVARTDLCPCLPNV